MDATFTRRYGKLQLAKTRVCVCVCVCVHVCVRVCVCVWWSQGTRKVSYKAFNNLQVSTRHTLGGEGKGGLGYALLG